MRTNYVVKIYRQEREMKIFEGSGKLLQTVPGISDRPSAVKYLEQLVYKPQLTVARDDWFMHKNTPYIVYSDHWNHD